MTDEEILASILDWARNEGVLPVARGRFRQQPHMTNCWPIGTLRATDRVLIFNTGAGLKYADVIAEAMNLKRPQ